MSAPPWLKPSSQEGAPSGGVVVITDLLGDLLGILLGAKGARETFTKEPSPGNYIISSAHPMTNDGVVTNS
jgi:hypothetical protein